MSAVVMYARGVDHLGTPADLDPWREYVEWAGADQCDAVAPGPIPYGCTRRRHTQGDHMAGTWDINADGARYIAARWPQ